MTLLEQIRANIRTQLDTRAAAQTALDAVVTGAEARGDATLTADEDALLVTHRASLAAADLAIGDLQTREAELAADAERRAAAEKLSASLPAREVPPVQVPATPGQLVRVGAEPHTYRQGGEASFFADLYAMNFPAAAGENVGAAERIAAHRAEVAVDEKRANVIADFGGLVPPQYLVNMFAPVARAGRPFLNALNSMPLPANGNTFTIPRVTTGTAAAATADGAAWSTQNMAETDLTFKAELVTAYEDISRSTFMRASWMVDMVVFPDMVAAYQSLLDSIGLNGSGTTPQHRGVLNVAGINAVTFTSASPTVSLLWPKLADAIQRVNANRFLPASVIVMHPRRWGWLKAATDTTGRPLIPDSDDGSFNSMGIGSADEYGQIVGGLQGLPVVTDANIPTNLGAGTNEDVILVCRSFDLLLWEDNGGDPYQFTFEQTVGPQQVRLAVGNFSGFTGGRYPAAISTVGGTGLVTPGF